MENEIDIPKVPLSRTEQYLTKIVKELSGSDEEVEIPKTTLSRVEMYLKAIIDLLAEAAVKKPITVKGTVDSFEKLPKDAVTGDLYFVKNGDSENTDEYIKTEDGWDKIGGAGVDLTGYVKTSDWASSTKPGVVVINKKNGLETQGPLLTIYSPTNEEMQHNDVMLNHTALTYSKISDVVNYYIDGKSLEKDPVTHTVQIHHPTTEEISAEGADLEHQALTLDRVKRVAEWYGLTDQNTLRETYVTKEELGKICVKKYVYEQKLGSIRKNITALNMVPHTATVINVSTVFSISKNGSGAYSGTDQIFVVPIQTNMLYNWFEFIAVGLYDAATHTFIDTDMYDTEKITITIWYIDNLPFVES